MEISWKRKKGERRRRQLLGKEIQASEVLETVSGYSYRGLRLKHGQNGMLLGGTGILDMTAPTLTPAVHHSAPEQNGRTLLRFVHMPGITPPRSLNQEPSMAPSCSPARGARELSWGRGQLPQSRSMTFRRGWQGAG